MNWRFQYDVNKYVREGREAGQDFKQVASKIFEELNGKRGFRTEDAEEILDLLKTAQNVEEFDIAWEQLYDYADDHHIWLGI